MKKSVLKKANPQSGKPPKKSHVPRQLIETLTGPEGELLYEATHRINSDNVLETTSKVWHDKNLEITNKRMSEGTLVRGSGASDVIAAGKLAWDIIKEGKVVGQSADAMTSVLSKADMDPMNYVNSRDGSSGEYKWRVNDKTFKKVNYVTIRLKVEGKFHATPRSGSPAPKGYYLPSVYVNILECRVNFPCSAHGSANLTNPSNIGSQEETNAEVKIHAKLSAGWFAQYLGVTIGFAATGLNGFKLLGKE